MFFIQLTYCTLVFGTYIKFQGKHIALLHWTCDVICIMYMTWMLICAAFASMFQTLCESFLLGSVAR